MTLVPPQLVDKYCFVYCGPERCNCIRGNYHKKDFKAWTESKEFEQEYPATFIGPDSDNESTPVS